MVRRHSLMELGRFQNEHDEVEEQELEEEEDNNAVVGGSPFSGDDELPAPEPEEDAYLPSPKKSRRSTRKKVVTYPIGEGLRSRGDVYPPPDSWSWRKYGQKPIKGSPYPRGYYRCSTSKGCPAKKQVERSRHDPTTLLITYSCEHNHSTTKTNHHQPAPPASSSPPTSTPTNFSSEECAAFANQTDIEPAASNTFVELAGEYGWLCEVDSTMMDKTTFITPIWTHGEVEVVMPIGEEDELLFGDLGDLPESAVVFRHRMNSCDPVS